MKTVAAFALGFGAGMVCLAVVLWSTGSLVHTCRRLGRTVPETHSVQAPAFDRVRTRTPPLPAVPASAAHAVPAPPLLWACRSQVSIRTL